MMMLRCGPSKQELAPAPVVYTFFDTIACRLESTNRGSVYPLLLDRLHDGRISSKDARAALQELSSIEAGLQRVAPAQILGITQSRSASDFFTPLLLRLRCGI